MNCRSALLALSLAASASAALAEDPGALIRLTLEARIGVLLDELPAGLRERAAQSVLGRGDGFWTARAEKQIAHTRYVLTYRRHFYPHRGKRQLMLPPREVWRIELLGAPSRESVGGRDAVVRAYRFEALLLSDPRSPAEAEPALATVGGVWEEPFHLPLDPMLVFQRTGYACMDESENPPGSVFEENTEIYFDHYCEGRGGDTWCHVTEVPELSCIEALVEHAGAVFTSMRFERLAWDAELADRSRVGPEQRPAAAELAVRERSLHNHWTVYRHFEASACALVERCVGAPGWRRLLLFDAEVVNRGLTPLHMGNPRQRHLAEHHVYEFSACHRHHHFRYYGDFRLEAGGQRAGHKQAFCLIDTDRRYNDERTSLVSPYDACRHQGMSPGWGDSYDAGLDCQWIDVTGLGPLESRWEALLGFDFNPADLLCEGTPITDAEGRLRFEATSLRSESGAPVGRIACDFNPDHQADNRGAIEVALAPGSFVNAPCARFEPSPKRDCGFDPQPARIACEPGAPAALRCRDGGEPALVRVCEWSATLGIGIPCTYRQSLATEVVAGEAEVAFTCPAGRAEAEPGGAIAVFTAPLFEAQISAGAACRLEPGKQAHL